MASGSPVASGARRVTLGDGTGLHCVTWPPAEVAGDGRRGPFLLVHGLASNGRTWEAVAGRLAAAGHPAATVDLRGHGGSDAPARGYDFATLCDDLEAVLDAVGFERAVVVGQSTGGNIAVELAARAPERLAGVAGIDGGILELQERWPAWDDCAQALAPPRLAGTPVVEVEAWLREDHPDWDDWGIEATLANLEVLPDGTVRARLRRDRHLELLRALWEHRPSRFLDRLGVAVLLVLADAGDHHTADRRAGAARAAAQLRRGRVHWLRPADHDVHVQQPAVVAELLLRAARDGFFA